MNKLNQRKHVCSIVLTEKLYQKIKKDANEEQISMSELIRRILYQYYKERNCGEKVNH
tara:strand:+ start:471 stop:644 length:174 start_codon:yes stop_codon:yes gene_type:complete